MRITYKKRKRLINRLDELSESIAKAKKYDPNNRALPILEELVEFLEDLTNIESKFVKTGENK